MKVLLIATVQSHICQFHKPLVAMLHEHGAEVHVAARDNLAEKNGLKLDFVEQVFNVPFHRSPYSPKNLSAYRQLRQIIDQGGYDVVHCNTPVGGVLGRLAARRARRQGTKVFYTAHGFHFYKGAPKKNWLIWYPVEKFMCRYTNKLITITEEDYQLAKKRFPVDAVRTHGVGADSEKYRRLSPEACLALRQELGYGAAERLILCTGELNENKNQTTAIRAMAEVVQKVPAAKLLIAGNGPMRDALEAEIEALGLSAHVELLGYRTDLERYVNISDVILSCSFREGLPMNIVEGMLCAKPVVASENRGHRELIVDGVTGTMIPPRDVHGFADCIVRLLEDPDAACQQGEAGLQRAQMYADRAVCAELTATYALD